MEKWCFSSLLLRRDAMLSPPQGQRGEVPSSTPWLFLAGHQLVPWFWDMEEQSLEQQVMSELKTDKFITLVVILLFCTCEMSEQHQCPIPGLLLLDPIRGQRKVWWDDAGWQPRRRDSWLFSCLLWMGYGKKKTLR